MKARAGLITGLLLVLLVFPLAAPQASTGGGPTLYSSMGGFFTPSEDPIAGQVPQDVTLGAVTAARGSTIIFKTADFAHNFSTVVGLCESMSDEIPAECNVDVAGTAGTFAAHIYLHNKAPLGTFDFYCNLHSWMKGKITIVSA